MLMPALALAACRRTLAAHCRGEHTATSWRRSTALDGSGKDSKPARRPATSLPLLPTLKLPHATCQR